MAQQGRVKQYNQRPYDSSLSSSTNQWADWVTQALNWLIAQGTPVTPGLQTIALNAVNPTTPQIPSVGSLSGCITSPITFVATTTTITFYWDGTNGSTPLTVYRDDNTATIVATGNLLVSGLTASTTYFFYPFLQEIVPVVSNPTTELPGVHFVSLAGAIGTPAVAFTATSFLAAQRQSLRDHVPLSVILATTGAATPASGSSSGSGGSGGSGTGQRQKT